MKLRLLHLSLLCTALCGRLSAVPPAILDLAMEPPVINTNPGPEYSDEQRDYAMIIGMDRSPKGRIWAVWVAGGDSDKGYFVAASSDDDGATWSKPRLVIDPPDVPNGLHRRVLVGNFWTDPTGRLWLFYDQSMGYFDGRAGAWAITCDNPDADRPVWSAPRRIWHGATLNKPVVLKNGDWLMPISLWTRDRINPKELRDGFHELDDQRMAHLFISTDKGATWTRRGGVVIPQSDFDEHIFVELKNGRLWMLARTKYGIAETFSSDGGRTWTEPKPSAIQNPSARFFLRRLASGRLLLVKNGPLDQRTGRTQMTAFLSDDEGKSWKGGFVFEERKGVSYPDGFQAPDGVIHILYDRERAKEREILMARFTEADVLAGRLLAPGSRTKMLVSKALGPAKAERPATARSDARAAVESAHREIWKRFVDEHNIVLDYTDLDGRIIRPTPQDCRELKPSALSWGVPVEDGPMFNGLYLDALCNRWKLTKADADRQKARRLVDGLLFLSSLGKTPGFIARGVATDGTTTYPMGSNDQTTPWLYGIWRYVSEGVAEPAERARLIAKFTEVVEVLDKSGWRMPCDGGASQYRGDFTKPTWEGAPRLLFVMKAMHEFTGDARWQERYLTAAHEQVGKGQRSRLEICRTGMVFDPNQGPRHSWTGSEGVVCLRALWEMETDPALRAAYAQGLRASAELSAKSLPLCGQFDVNVTERFEHDWRVMNEAWKPQHSEAETVEVANAGLRVQHRASPRLHLEKDYMREPCFAAWVVTLCPDDALVALHREAIIRVIEHYRYERLYLSQFFPVESAWYRLNGVSSKAGVK